MKSVRLRRSSVARVARPLPLVAAMAFALATLAGCGGGGATHVAPATAPPSAPAPAPTTASSTGRPDDAPAMPPPTPGTADARPNVPGPDVFAAGWRYRFDMISPPNDNFGVTTREVYLYFKPDTSMVTFRLENRLGVPIKILWDESTFLDVYGRSFKAVHRGATYESRDNPQEASIVNPGERYSDFLLPVDAYNDPTAATGGKPRNLLPTDLSAQSLVGRIFGPTLVLGLESGERKEFEVRFRIASVYNDR